MISEINLSGNNFTGTIPTSYAAFSSSYVDNKDLSLDDNFLVAPVPDLMAFEGNSVMYRMQYDPADVDKVGSTIDIAASYMSASCSPADTLALVALYDANESLTWDLSTPVSQWGGVDLMQSSGVVRVHTLSVDDIESIPESFLL